MAKSLELPNLTHHAYVIVGDDSHSVEVISILEKEHSIPIQGNPDFFHKKYEVLTIDDAREIKSFHSTRPVNDSGKKVFVITLNGITIEAQNALLKLLEEPGEYAHFFLIVPSEHLLLPTVRSRVSFLRTHESKEQKAKSKDGEQRYIEAEQFVQANVAKRIDIVGKLLEDIKKEKKTKHDAVLLLNAIESVVYTERGVKTGKAALEVIETARKYATDRAPSMKMLLEYVALNI